MSKPPIVSINQIGIDSEGRLFISPGKEEFEHIWRYAAGVNWDHKKRYLYSPAPTAAMTHFDWFRQILMAVQYEYGIKLQVTGQSVWYNIPPSLQGEIMAYTDSERTT